MIFRLTLALILALGTLTAYGSDDVRVAIVTCSPGADIYQLEGHTALHITSLNDSIPFDVAINYGVFDFNSPNFVYRFVKGETDYLCAAAPWEYFLNTYVQEGRRVIEHPILLDSIQSERLMVLLNDNLRPENRVYRYNYVKDNCATRPLALIEQAIGDTIIVPEPKSALGQGQTFREVMADHHRNYPWYQFGIDLALGSGIDYKISAREKTFAPTLLGEQLDSARVRGRLLTAPAIVVYPGRDNVIEGPTPWYATPMAASIALLVITLLITIHDIRRRAVSQWFDTILYTLYGIAGLILTFLIFVSVHEATSPNWLYMWLNPLCLVVPAFIWLKKCKIVVFSYQIINFALLLIMIAAWPLTGQSGNASFVPLIGCDLLRSFNYIYINRRK